MPRRFPLLRDVLAIRWSTFQTAHGSARWVPLWLVVFRFGPRWWAARAGHRLWCSLCHQHAYVSSAALPAAPFIIDVLARPQPTVVEEALDILLGFLRCTDPTLVGSASWHSELRSLVLGVVPTVHRLAESGHSAVADMARSLLAEAGGAWLADARGEVGHASHSDASGTRGILWALVRRRARRMGLVESNSGRQLGCESARHDRDRAA